MAGGATLPASFCAAPVLYWFGVELFLNFIWLFVSVLLVVHWTRASKPESSRQIGKAVVALLLLIVVLLPVISATDDLIAMTGLLEGEHAEHVVRRGEMPLLDVEQGGVTPISLTLFAVLFVDLAFLRTLMARVVLRSGALRLVDGFGSATGIRPPPAVALIAA